MNSYLTANEIRVIVELHVMPSREEYNFCDVIKKLRQKELLENDSLDFTKKGQAVLDYILFVPVPRKVADIFESWKKNAKELTKQNAQE